MNLINTNYFEYFFMILVVMNTILLCLDGLVNVDQIDTIKKISAVLTYIFLSELAIKVIALGPMSH